MNPIDFKESNGLLRRPDSMTDDECGSLCIYSDGTLCISKWRMSLRERLSAAILGVVWLQVVSGATQPPVGLDTKFPFEDE